MNPIFQDLITTITVIKENFFHKNSSKRKMEGEELVLLDYWCSPYVLRVKIALAEKGITEYVCKEQDLVNKGSLLIEMNPIHKTVPVLIHNGQPICESLLILQYIDDVWAHSSPLLPLDPYLRSQAQFWGDFIDKKIYDVGEQLLKAKEEEQEILGKKFLENLNILEGVLKNDNFFGGDTFGYIDIALVPTICWFFTFEKLGNFKIEPKFPKIVAWAKRCNERQSVSDALPDPEKIYSYVLELKKMNRI
ncbi:putative glutathione S-transferase parA [Bienertia sinuspersici]